MYNRDENFYEQWKMFVGELESAVEKIEGLLQGEKTKEEEEAMQRIENAEFSQKVNEEKWKTKQFLNETEEWS